MTENPWLVTLSLRPRWKRLPYALSMFWTLLRMRVPLKSIAEQVWFTLTWMPQPHTPGSFGPEPTIGGRSPRDGAAEP